MTVADKGFDMKGDFSSRRHILVVPPKARKNQVVFSSDEMDDTAAIARERIHVERAFKRVQEFQCLHSVVPITMLDLWSSVFRVCCFMSNYEMELIQDK